MNPLLGDWTTPFGMPPFGEIETGHFAPAFDAALAEDRAEVDRIAANPEAPSFANTIEAMERSGSGSGDWRGLTPHGRAGHSAM
jgi:peptidyl-dipeptidase Dcp